MGYFCIAGGIALGTSTIIGPLSSWGALLAAGPLTKLAPTLATAFALMATLEHCSHPLALPSMLLAIPLAFHAVLALSGLSLQDAMAAGWVMQPPVSLRAGCLRMHAAAAAHQQAGLGCCFSANCWLP